MTKSFNYSLTLLFSVLFFVSLAIGQPTQRGSFLVGGTGGFNTSSSSLEVTEGGVSENSQGPQTLALNAAPNLAYFVANNVALGFSMNYALQTVNIDDTRTIDSDLLVGPMARLYLPINEKQAGFIHVGSGFGNTVDDFVIDGESIQATTLVSRFAVGPGFTLFSNNKVGIEASAMYNFIRTSTSADAEGISVDNISRTNEFDVRLGVQFYLSRNRN